MSTNKIIVTGGAGFLGRSVVAALRRRGVPDERLFVPRSAQHDLRDPRAAAAFMQSVVSAPLGAGWGSGEDGSVEGLAAPLIIHCAGRVGGIGLNRAHPAGMLHDNLTIALNTCEAAVKAGFADAGGKFVMVGSMTSYPADAELPYREESLFCGLPDPEIASYGLAKLAAIQMLRAYRLEHGLRGSCPILVNLYGPGDNIDDPLVAHAAGAMIKRFVEAADKNAPEVVCWGSGEPTRDFLYVDDAAEGVLRAAEEIDDGMAVNIASGTETSIRTMAEKIAHLAGFEGNIIWDRSKGDGVSRRCLDISRAKESLAWSPRVSLDEGVARTIRWIRTRNS